MFWWLLLSFVLGGVFVFCAACCVVAKRADEMMGKFDIDLTDLDFGEEQKDDNDGE